MKKIIVPTGYMGSGSSAVTGLVSEYKNVNNSYGDFEYVFLHCPNGLFDLEDKLLIGNNALRSDEAIHSFLHEMKDLYDRKYWWVGDYKKRIGKDFYEKSLSFANSITSFELNDYWYVQEKTNTKMFWQLLLRKIVSLGTFKKVSLKKPLLYDKMCLSYISSDEFYSNAKKYIYDVLNMIDSGKDDILLDQLLLPYNLKRIDNYFDDDIKVIVVSRDPRDVFILNKYIWPIKKLSVPFSHNVEEFCKQYKELRKLADHKPSSKILEVQFEDLIYKYDETNKRIASFLGYSEKNHINRFKSFNPDISIKNTQLFNKKEYLNESEYIKKELKEYIYDFPYVLENDVKDTIG